MSNEQTQPTNQTGRYDAARVAGLKPIKRTIHQLQLPTSRLRKVLSICNALEMQIEDGGDSPDVNRQLLKALKLAVLHQVSRQEAGAVLPALDDFARREAAYWEQLRAR